MRGVDLLHGFGEHFELLPVVGVVAIAFGFIARAIEMSRKSADSEKTTSPPIPKVPELL
jgi:hypothetical protein